MKRIKNFLLLSFLILSLFSASLAQACFNPTDSFAVEVILNKPGIVYDLAKIKNAVGVSTQDNSLIYHSHYNENAAVILSEDESSENGLGIKIQIPTKEVTTVWTIIRIEKTLDYVKMADISADKATVLGWQVVGTEDIPQSSASLTKNENIISLRAKNKAVDYGMIVTIEIKGKIDKLTDSLKNEFINVLKTVGLSENEAQSIFEQENIKTFPLTETDLTEGVAIKAAEFEFDEALKKELQFLVSNQIINGLSEQDIVDIYKLAEKGKAGYNERIRWFKNKWVVGITKEMEQAGFSRLKSLPSCGGFSLSLLPQSVLDLTFGQITEQEQKNLWIFITVGIFILLMCFSLTVYLLFKLRKKSSTF
jgi:hypothetical protein